MVVYFHKWLCDDPHVESHGVSLSPFKHQTVLDKRMCIQSSQIHNNANSVGHGRPGLMVNNCVCKKYFRTLAVVSIVNRFADC